jgi:uncharacterized protein
MQASSHIIAVGPAGHVSAVLDRPSAAQALFVMAHGAGAGMHHPFVQAVADALAERAVATLRYQFPFTEANRRQPDRAPVLEATVRAAVAAAAQIAPDLPLIAGGKSMGGRMTSRAAADGGLAGVRGLVFLGFPLHPPQKPSTDRAQHLASVALPMLFLQGTRDALARLDLMQSQCDRLGARAHLHVVDGADHGFHVLKRSGRTDAQVIDEIADAVARFSRAA